MNSHSNGLQEQCGKIFLADVSNKLIDLNIRLLLEMQTVSVEIASNLYIRYSEYGIYIVQDSDESE